VLPTESPHNSNRGRGTTQGSSSTQKQESSPNNFKFFNENAESILSRPISRRSYVELKKEDIMKYMNFSQQYAAKMLGVSVSTLKRRFYELNMGIYMQVMQAH
jgi:hypothetical protein